MTDPFVISVLPKLYAPQNRICTVVLYDLIYISTHELVYILLAPSIQL